MDNEREASAKLFDGISEMNSLRCPFNWSFSFESLGQTTVVSERLSEFLLKASRWLYLSFQLPNGVFFSDGT